MTQQTKEERLAKQRLYYHNHKQQYKEYGQEYYKKHKTYFKEYYKIFYNTPKDYNGTLMTYAQNYYKNNKEHLTAYQREYSAKKRNQLKLPEMKQVKPVKPPVPKSTSKLIRKRIEIEKHLKEMAEKAAAFKSSLENSG